jgi:hypothetical protein
LVAYIAPHRMAKPCNTLALMLDFLFDKKTYICIYVLVSPSSDGHFERYTSLIVR